MTELDELKSAVAEFNKWRQAMRMGTFPGDWHEAFANLLAAEARLLELVPVEM